jgi:hypothetical protein
VGYQQLSVQAAALQQEMKKEPMAFIAMLRGESE